MRTLRVYLAQGRKMAQAAAELGVHYNTLRYRLKKIRELLGEGWDDPQRRLALELALHLQPLVPLPPEEG
jgi:DNA-binding PucR family transcriptional regulator